MSARSLGIALLLHALLIGVALQQLSEPRQVQPESVLAVATEIHAATSLPQPQSSPALPRAWPAPELELPGEVPAPDREFETETEPQPAHEPEPQLMDVSEAEAPPVPRTPAETHWQPREPIPEVAEVMEPAEPQPLPSDSAGKPKPSPRSGVLQGFPNPDTPPRILNPRWPRTVRDNFTGTVQIRVVVGMDGRAMRVELLEGTGNETWDERLLKIFQEADYIPGVHQGMVLITSHVFRVHFKRGG